MEKAVNQPGIATRDRFSELIAGLNAETSPILGIVADRLILTAPKMFPTKIWGGSGGLRPRRRMKKLHEMFDIPEASFPSGELSLLRFRVNAVEWVPHPGNAPNWSLTSPQKFVSVKFDGYPEYARCKQWEKENDENVKKLVKDRLVGLGIRAGAVFVIPGPYVDVAVWLDYPSPELLMVNTVWRNETELAVLVRKFFPDAIREHSPQWLGWQRLDVYVPSRKLAFEYQGKQHYEPIGFFGGAEGYASRVKQDQRKKLLCAENGVTLFEWPYHMPVSEQHLLQQLALFGIKV